MIVFPENLEILEYSENNKEYIKLLNYEWLEKYFRIESGDVEQLNNPKTHIIDKGGYIFYALMDKSIVGVIALLKHNDYTFELAKFAVTENKQGLGIGKFLIDHALTVAKKIGVETIYLYSNTSLISAIHLWKKYGFNEVALEKGLYERANIKMEKKI